MEGVSTLLGIGELGCSEPMAPPPGPGLVPVSTPEGIEWQPLSTGGAPTVTVAVVAGRLTLTVNGVAASLAGVPVADAFGAPLGYLWPL